MADSSTGCRARPHGFPGSPCWHVAVTQRPCTMPATAAAVSPFVNGGISFGTSLLTWASVPRVLPSTGSTTMGTTNRGTVAGRPQLSNRQTDVIVPPAVVVRLEKSVLVNPEIEIMKAPNMVFVVWTFPFGLQQVLLPDRTVTPTADDEVWRSTIPTIGVLSMN